MGAGRTELARSLFGIDEIDSGTIFIYGHEVKISSPWEAIELGLGYLTENRTDGLIPRLSVTANIILASLKRLCTMGFLRRYKEKVFSEKYIPIEKIKKTELYSSPKIIIRQLGDQINAMVDMKDNFVTMQAIYNIKVLDEAYDYNSILGILNSKMMNFYYSIMYKEKDLFPRILLENIKDLPIPLDLKEKQEKISEKVQQLIEKKKENEKIEKLEIEINNIIFELYNLENNEIEYITNFLD